MLRDRVVEAVVLWRGRGVWGLRAWGWGAVEVVVVVAVVGAVEVEVVEVE